MEIFVVIYVYWCEDAWAHLEDFCGVYSTLEKALTGLEGKYIVLDGDEDPDSDEQEDFYRVSKDTVK